MGYRLRSGPARDSARLSMHCGHDRERGEQCDGACALLSQGVSASQPGAWPAFRGSMHLGARR